jgi:hypothetical protein
MMNCDHVLLSVAGEAYSHRPESLAPDRLAAVFDCGGGRF